MEGPVPPGAGESDKETEASPRGVLAPLNLSLPQCKVGLVMMRVQACEVNQPGSDTLSLHPRSPI